jgi:hypothetical protein
VSRRDAGKAAATGRKRLLLARVKQRKRWGVAGARAAGRFGPCSQKRATYATACGSKVRMRREGRAFRLPRQARDESCSGRRVALRSLRSEEANNPENQTQFGKGV